MDGPYAGSIALVTDCLVIAVDGPAGSGKSSAAREVARSLGLRYLDTGAMYRALTWWLLANHVDVASAAPVAQHMRRAEIEIGTDPDAPAIRVGGADVAGPIRTREVSNAVSAVAAGEGIVAEGRDVGSVVAPEAPVKVFLTASETVRARRRSADLAGQPGVTLALTQTEQE